MASVTPFFEMEDLLQQPEKCSTSPNHLLFLLPHSNNTLETQALPYWDTEHLNLHWLSPYYLVSAYHLQDPAPSPITWDLG